MKEIVALIVLLVLDISWIALNRSKYDALTQAVQGSPLEMYVPGAIAAYVCIFGLLVLFVIPVYEEVQKSQGTLAALGRAWLIGALVYGIYDMTSLAIYKGFSWGPAILDMVWGGVLFAAVSSLSHLSS